MRKSAPLLCLTLALASTPAAGELLDEVRAWRRANEKAILGELVTLLEIPNVARDRENIERNAAHLVGMLEARGIEARLLRADGAPPAVFGSLDAPGATRTVVFYAHYDGQPAAEADGWESDPWTPVLRDGIVEEGAAELPWSALDGTIDPEWRIYARSASDDKSPIVAMLAALDALRAAGAAPSVNLRFFFEGEEEAGSRHLGEILARNRDLLAADLWLFWDGPVHQSRRGQVVFGVRGVTALEMTLYGASRGLHSGHYGNWAPNPAAQLAELLASMRDGEGRITIEGFYDRVRPLGEAERKAIEAIPDPDAGLRHDLALARSEAGNARLVDRLMIPALNVRGLASGGVGAEARNAIPTEAKASIDFRLVPDLTPDMVRSLVEAHIRARGFHIVADEPDLATRRAHAKVIRLQWERGYPALRTPMDLPASRAVVAAVEQARGERIVAIPNLGGSLPLYLFDEILGAPLIVTPMVNHDNNQHAANENLRIRNLWEGIDMAAIVMARLGELWP
ncbi:MAG TPA: M20/M25/M40 family metallo-hydrolase [Thermoanaerobaculia bacterium]|nr:M20/M25/M40 family metallo-hydrolase [Thermoanaerobaculia bacterium]